MTTGYYALDRPNPNAVAKGYPGFWGYPTMRNDPHAIVLHTTESLADLDGPDAGAENVAAWFQTNDTFALYHTLVDSDSTVRVVPAGLDGTVAHTAFHTAGYNSSTLGLSMALRADSWPTLPQRWRDAVLDRAAAEAARWCSRWSIPAEARTKADVDAGGRGITGHGILDPGWRSDPGAAFDWPGFILRVRRILAGTALAGPPAPPIDQPNGDDVVRLIRHPDNGTLWWWDGQTRARVTPAPGVFATVDELRLGLERLVAAHPRATRWDDTPAGLWLDVPAHDLELIPER